MHAGSYTLILGGYAILNFMDSNHQIWRALSDSLHRWGLRELAATFLESLGPLTLLGAQALYLGQPFLGAIMPHRYVEAAAHILEDAEATQGFVAFLREAD